MIRPALAASAVTAALTAGVGAGVSGDWLPHRAMPVMLTAWGAMIVVTAILWTGWHVVGYHRAVRDLSSIVARDLTRGGAGSRPAGSSRQAR